MPLEAGIALIFGANVGTCLTALLASLGKTAEALQVGVVHLLFNVLGVLIWIFFIPQLADLVRHIFTDRNGPARHRPPGGRNATPSCKRAYSF
jgi:phosphate:Na+ symporter